MSKSNSNKRINKMSIVNKSLIKKNWKPYDGAMPNNANKKPFSHRSNIKSIMSRIFDFIEHGRVSHIAVFYMPSKSGNNLCDVFADTYETQKLIRAKDRLYVGTFFHLMNKNQVKTTLQNANNGDY